MRAQGIPRAIELGNHPLYAIVDTKGKIFGIASDIQICFRKPHINFNHLTDSGRGRPILTHTVGYGQTYPYNPEIWTIK